MRKYKQLLLLIISIISLSLLLVYRHEYNRLHYILEVFNFFGQPCNFSELQLAGNAHEPNWGVKGLWQDNEDIYIYSGFWTTKNETKAIVLQTDPKQKPRNCFLWFEDRTLPLLGKFKYSPIKYSDKFKQGAYLFYCSLANSELSELSPYAISFTVKKVNVNSLKKVFLTNLTFNKYATNASICVAPTSFNKALLIEFLSYHHLIGIDHFLFYQQIPHRLAQILSNLSVKLGFKLSFMDWNYPKVQENSLTRTIVETDCKLRLSTLAKNVITLESDEFLVPSRYTALKDVLHDYDSNVLSERISIPVQTFCITNTNPRSPLVIQNNQVSYDSTNVVRHIFRTDYKENVVVNQVIIKGAIAIHKYSFCKTNIKTRNYQDDTIKRFNVDLTRTTLMQLLLHNQI